MADRKPFHETIINALRDVDSFDVLDLFAELIRVTKISENHDAIATAWREALEKIGWEDTSGFGILSDLEEQKQEAEAEAKKQWKAKNAEIIADALSDL